MSGLTFLQQDWSSFFLREEGVLEEKVLVVVLKVVVVGVVVVRARCFIMGTCFLNFGLRMALELKQPSGQRRAFRCSCLAAVDGKRCSILGCVVIIVAMAVGGEERVEGLKAR